MIVCRSFNISSIEDKDKLYFQIDSTTPVTNHFYDQFLTTGKGMNMCHILQGSAVGIMLSTKTIITHISS